MSSTDLKTYNGNCHCGAFKYSISLPEITSATDCSCSMCQRKGYLFVDAKAGPLVIHRGENDGTLQRYTFSTEKWPHDFCKTCGITCIIRELGTEKVFINANTVMGLDVWKLKIEHMDGRNWGGDFKTAPPVKAPTPPEGENTKYQTYHGQCHCGKVRFALLSPDIYKERVSICNCSICTRAAYLFHYSPHELANVEGMENTTVYRGVGSKMASHRFCATCGVPVCITTDVELPKEMLDSFPEELRDRIQKLPLNLHLIEGLEFGKMDILKETEGQEGYEIPE